MRVLALDTTTRAGSVAIVRDSEVMYEQAGEAERSHAERMPLEIERALTTSGLTLDAIDLFAVASGPGSFTGLRIGIATIQGLAMVAAKPVVAVSALEALAESVRPQHAPGARVAAWMDAFRKDVFSALFVIPSNPDDDLIVIEDAAVEPPASAWARYASERSGAAGDELVLVGDGAVRYHDVTGGRVHLVPPVALAASLARIAIRRARRGEVQHPSQILPLYVRRPDAEVAREKSR